MIDDPEKTDRLVAALEALLPIETRLSQALKAYLIKRSPDLEIPDRCNIIGISYAGVEGGIVCRLDIGGQETETPYVVSITHLIFDRRVPLFRQIDVYQRHRVKKIKRLNERGY
jgi:hypothetical protein